MMCYATTYVYVNKPINIVTELIWIRFPVVIMKKFLK